MGLCSNQPPFLIPNIIYIHAIYIYCTCKDCIGVYIFPVLKKKHAYYKYCVSRIISFSSSINITFTKSLKVADQTELIMQLWLKSLKHCSRHHHPTSSPSSNRTHTHTDTHTDTHTLYLNV